MTDDLTPPKLLPPHYFVMSIVFMLCSAYFSNWHVTQGAWQLSLPWVGGVLMLFGIGIAVLGSRLFAKAGTNIIPFTKSDALVTSGVFSLSRNPMYLGMLIALAGLALGLNQYLPWLAVGLMFCILKWGFIQHEEKLMQDTFGVAYETYRKNVGRWF